MSGTAFPTAALEEATDANLFDLYMTYRNMAHELQAFLTLRLGDAHHNDPALWISNARRDYLNCYGALEDIANEAIRRHENEPSDSLIAVMSLAEMDIETREGGQGAAGLKLH